MKTETAFEAFCRGLQHVHQELRDGASGVLEASTAGDDRLTDERIAVFTQELLDHHKAEASFLFPGFRAVGRLRSTDVAFLDARDAEHIDIHRLAIELQTVGQQHRRGALAKTTFRKVVPALAGDLTALSLPHFAIEESTLTPSYLEEMISAKQLVTLQRDIGKNWHRR